MTDAPKTAGAEAIDPVEIVRRRLADGRTIADCDVVALVAEIDRLRALVATAAVMAGDVLLGGVTHAAA